MSSSTSDVCSNHDKVSGEHHLYCGVCHERKNKCSCDFVARFGKICQPCGRDPKQCDCLQDSKHIVPVCERDNCKKTKDECDCARFNGRSLCACLTCHKPRKIDLPSADDSAHCHCEVFESPCKLDHVRHFQFHTDAQMYDIFKLKASPALTQACSLSIFLALKPWYVLVS